MWDIIGWILGAGIAFLALMHLVSIWISPLRRWLQVRLYASRILFFSLAIAVICIELNRGGGSDLVRYGAWTLAALAFGVLYYYQESRRIETGLWLAKSDLEYLIGMSNTMHRAWGEASVFRGAPRGVSLRPFRGVRSGQNVLLFEFNEGELPPLLSTLLGPPAGATVALAPLDGRVEGRVVIRPHDAKDAVAAATGLTDINFESHEFSQMYHVSATERRLAYAAVTPRVMMCLLSGKPVCVELAGNAVTVTLGHRKLAWAEDCPRLLEVAGEFAAALPAFLRQPDGGQRPIQRR